MCGRVAIIPSSHPEEQRNLLRKNFSFAIIDMGNGIGKLPAAAYHEKNTNQSCRMEERMERLEGEIKKIKAEIDGRPQQNSFESPVLNRRPSHSINCATRTNNPGLRRLSTMSIGEQSKYIGTEHRLWLYMLFLTDYIFNFLFTVTRIAMFSFFPSFFLLSIEFYKFIDSLITEGCSVSMKTNSNATKGFFLQDVKRETVCLLCNSTRDLMFSV